MLTRAAVMQIDNRVEEIDNRVEESDHYSPVPVTYKIAQY